MSIFAKIIAGEIPCYKVYEDEHILAFLDVNPISEGHTLVIPKESAETLDRLSDASAAALGRVLPRICRAVMQATGTEAYNVLQNNGTDAHQVVMHVHFHIIPRYADDAASGGPQRRSKRKRGLGLVWNSQPLDDERGEALALTMSKLMSADK